MSKTTKLNTVTVGNVSSESALPYITTSSSSFSSDKKTKIEFEDVEIKGKLMLNGVDMSVFIDIMAKRMLALQPDFEKHEKYPALKEAYDNYKMIESMLVDEEEK